MERYSAAAAAAAALVLAVHGFMHLLWRAELARRRQRAAHSERRREAEAAQDRLVAQLMLAAAVLMFAAAAMVLVRLQLWSVVAGAGLVASAVGCWRSWPRASTALVADLLIAVFVVLGALDLLPFR